MDAAVANAMAASAAFTGSAGAGEKANKLFNSWLPEETVAACREYLVHQGTADDTVGGIRS
jgi:isocitrate dehydrogenase